jgi:hypothetical protein
VGLLEAAGHGHGVHERGAHGPLAAGVRGRKDDASSEDSGLPILTRAEGPAVRQPLVYVGADPFLVVSKPRQAILFDRGTGIHVLLEQPSHGRWC